MTRDELMELSIEGRKVSELLLDMTGKTGEKIELPAYNTIEAPCVAYYNHNGNRLATIAGFNISHPFPDLNRQSVLFYTKIVMGTNPSFLP